MLPGALTPAALWATSSPGGARSRPPPPEAAGASRARRRWGTPSDALDRAWSDGGGYVRGFEAGFDPSGFASPPTSIAALDPLFHWVLTRRARGAARRGTTRRRARAGLVLGNLSFPSSSLSRLRRERLARRAGPRSRRSRGGARRRRRARPAQPLHVGAARAPRRARARARRRRLRARRRLRLVALRDQARLRRAARRARRPDARRRGQPRRRPVPPRRLLRARGAEPHRAQPARSTATPTAWCPRRARRFVALERLDGRGAPRATASSASSAASACPTTAAGAGCWRPRRKGRSARCAALRARRARARRHRLVECHATGTPVGDATEIRSMARVFAGLRATCRSAR